MYDMDTVSTRWLYVSAEDWVTPHAERGALAWCEMRPRSPYILHAFNPRIWPCLSCQVPCLTPSKQSYHCVRTRTNIIHLLSYRMIERDSSYTLYIPQPHRETLSSRTFEHSISVPRNILPISLTIQAAILRGRRRRPPARFTGRLRAITQSLA